MPPANVYLAIGLGAESGRVVAGHFDGRFLELEEVRRFPNVPLWENAIKHNAPVGSKRGR